MILTLQIWGSYALIRNIFRWLALALFAYVGAAVLARPSGWEVLKGTLVPTIEPSRDFLAILVAIIGTTMSAYIYTWQTNVEVEEKIAQGQSRAAERRGASRAELRRSQLDIAVGMLFSNVIMYFIILSTGATLHKAGHGAIETAAQAAEALQPVAGDAAGLLFTVGIIAVGFLAVPVMTTGAAYDLCQVMGWQSTLHAKPEEATKFYLTIAAFTALAVGLNFVGFNPMKALVYAGVVQGFSTPPLLLLIMLMTGSRELMGTKVNGWPMACLGWATVAIVFAASAALIVTLLL